MYRARLICATIFVVAPLCINAQIQKGQDIDGEAEDDQSGCSVSMPDSNTVAIGAYNNDGNGSNAGHVRVYSWTGSAWVQKGADIDGEATYDFSGCSVSMPDANTVAIGAYNNEGNGSGTGHARVYSWNGGAWIQKGPDIDGEVGGSNSGVSVSMPDANTIAIGDDYNYGNGTEAGAVCIYSWSGSAWIHKGSGINGEAAGDRSGCAVSMPDSNTVAIGAWRNDGNGTDAGHVRIFTWNDSVWVQKGSDIDGEAAWDNSGTSVSMPDPNTVAIGATCNDGGASEAGHVRIYSWIGGAWVQKGADIDGDAFNNFLGHSVSMPDSNTVAVGASGYDGNGFDAGLVRIFSWNGSAWIQLGADIVGEAAYDASGCSVSMPDTKTVAIGAIHNDGGGNQSGHVRIYSLYDVGVQYNDFAKAPVIYPNPTSGQVIIDLNSIYKSIDVIIRNELGQELKSQGFCNTNSLQINIPGDAGIYFIEVTADKNKAVLKVKKN
jgi:hypothetical protein